MEDMQLRRAGAIYTKLPLKFDSKVIVYSSFGAFQACLGGISPAPDNC